MAKRKPDQLDIDSTAAIKAGMSYGKYMATKIPVEIIQPEPQGVRRECQLCGAVFYHYGRRERKYCSDRCRKNAENKRARQIGEPIRKTCAMCGKEFLAETRRNKYCGPFCLKRAQAQQARACQMRKREKEGA